MSCAAWQPLRSGTIHDRGDVMWLFTATAQGDLPVRLVRGDHVLGGTKRPSLQKPQRPIRQARPIREAGLIQFRVKVVMVEDEPGPVQEPERYSDWPEYIRGVTGLNHGEPTR